MGQVEQYRQPGTEIWKETAIMCGNKHNNGRGAIVIPAYKNIDTLKPHEKASLKQCVKIFGEKYDIILVVPEGFETERYKNFVGYNFNVLEVEPAFLKSQKSYSNLCERYEFYDCFNQYEYILIYQLDAWVFEDDLEYFMNLGYDYIGGVHLIFGKTKGENGNGGFSLRKVDKFIEVCHSVDWQKVPRSQLEDCAFTQRFKDRFNLAPLDICYKFSWQESPSTAWIKNNHHLPFGCHAFHRFGASFWKKYIQY